jgi:hypothetical protein
VDGPLIPLIVMGADPAPDKSKSQEVDKLNPSPDPPKYWAFTEKKVKQKKNSIAYFNTLRFIANCRKFLFMELF